MTKGIRCKKRAKLLGWNHYEKVRNGSWDEEFLHRNNVHTLVHLPFLPFSKLFFSNVL